MIATPTAFMIISALSFHINATINQPINPIMCTNIFNELRERTGFKSRGERRRLEKAAGRRRYLKKQQKLKDARGY